MATIIIVHGMASKPESNWFPWLKSELEKLGHKVIVPAFPTPENQTLEKWLEVFQKYKPELNKDSILVGHSLGVPFILSVLEELDVKIKASFFVSGFVGLLARLDLDNLNKDICDVIFDWKLIHRHCEKFYVYHSDNDEYVPISKANYICRHLNIKPNIVKEAGHFNTNSGYDKFDLLLEDIKKELV